MYTCIGPVECPHLTRTLRADAVDRKRVSRAMAHAEAAHARLFVLERAKNVARCSQRRLGQVAELWMKRE